MKEQWRSSPQPSEQEPPAAQQTEAIPGAGAAPEEMPHEEEVCEKCGRQYSRAHEKELGKVARKTVREMTAETVAKDGRETPSESVVSYESLMACDKDAAYISTLSGDHIFNVPNELCVGALKFIESPPSEEKREALKVLWAELYRQLNVISAAIINPRFQALLTPEQRSNLEERRKALHEVTNQAWESYEKCRRAIERELFLARFGPGREWTFISPLAG